MEIINEIKHRIRMKLEPASKGLQSNMPSQRIGDMVLVYLLEDPAGFAVGITYELIDQIGITVDELEEAAREYAPKNFPASCTNLDELLNGLLSENERLILANAGLNLDPDMFIAQYENENRLGGAAVIMYPGFLKKCSEQIGHKNLWVIMSSKNEAILYIDKGDRDFLELEDMISEVNFNVVSDKDFLSDQIYHYNADEDKLTTGSRWDIENRRS